MGELFQQTNGKIEFLVGKVVNQLKATSFFWMGKVEESDLYTIPWTDKREGLEKFCLFIKKELYPILGPLFKVGRYAAYKEEDILDVLIYMAVNGVTTENGAEAFRDEFKRGPSARTIRRRLGNLVFSEVEEAFLEANSKILSYFEEKDMFEDIVLISNDISHVPCYRKRRKYACGMKRDRGTNYGYTYGSCVVSAPGMRVFLHTVAMTEFSNNEKMVEELITVAKKYVDIEAVLEDREFFNEKSINKLESLEIDFVIPVKKHRKKLLQSLRPPCKANIPLGSREVPVIAVKSPKDPKKTLYYCTAMKISDDELENVINIYKNRWTIENAFKSHKITFLAKTYSVNFAIRYFFWILSVLLYNAWMLCNFCASTALEVTPTEQVRPLITAFRFGINMKITFLSPSFSEDDPEEILCVAIALVKQYILKNSSKEEIIPQYMMLT